MQSKHQPVILNGEQPSPETNNKFLETAVPVQECDGEVHPATGGAGLEMAAFASEQAPRLVIRGESLQDINSTSSGEAFKLIATGYQGKAKLVYIPLAKQDGEPLAALTDYLNTTFPFNSSQENIVQLVQYFGLFLGKDFDHMEERKGGLHGYKTSFNIGKTGGMLAFGGQRGTALVSLPGSACALITDWQACYHLFNEILNGRITRWDGAVDMFDGVPPVDDAVNFYLTDQFNAGGNKPSCTQQGNWISLCHSLNVKTRPFGGLKSPSTDALYKKALERPTKTKFAYPVGAQNHYM